MKPIHEGRRISARRFTLDDFMRRGIPVCQDEGMNHEADIDNMDDVVETLREVSELLADRSLLILKEAHQAGQTRRPDAERVVTQARRSVEKAISLLSRGS